MSGRDGRLRFGVLGTGSIAAEVTDALHLTNDCSAEAVASRDPARAAAFGAAHGVPRSHDGYAELLKDPDVEVVYVATPHTEHAEWAIRAAQAGKHVLCEKPMTISARTTVEVVEAARRNGVFLMEAFAYHFHPQTDRLLELISDRTIGDLGAVDVTFSYRLPDPSQPPRALQADLGGGGILDVGCYCTSMSRRIVMAATGQHAVEPEEVVALAALEPVERTDRWAMAIMRFESDVLAQLSCGVSLTQDDHIRVYGSKGQIHIDQPCWLDGRRDAASRIEIRLEGDESRRVDIAGGRNIFALEADGVADMLRRGVDSCHASWDESIANMRTLDRWRAAAGVRYPGEDDG